MGNCCKRIVYPINPPIGVGCLVASRVTSYMLLLSTVVVLTLSIIFRDWKIEAFQDDWLEIGLWTICRYSTLGNRELHFNKCFDDYYSQQPYEAWFEFWRYFLVTSDVILLITFCTLCVQQIYRKDSVRKSWHHAGYACLASAFFIGGSLVIYWDKFPFEFVEETFRWPLMGWTEVTADRDGFIEEVGTPLMMCAASFFMCLITGYSCYITRYCEGRYVKQKFGEANDAFLEKKPQQPPAYI